MLISSLYFQYLSCFYIVLLAVVYFCKKRINNKETKIYSYLIISSVVGVILDVITTYLAYVDVTNIFLNPLCKLYLLYIVVWCYLLGIYIFYIAGLGKVLKKVLTMYNILNIIFSVIIMIIPLYNFSENGVIYTYGPGANTTYIIVGIDMFIYLLIFIFNYKKINIKKYYPVFAFIVFLILSALIQKYNPQVLLVTSAGIFVTFLMYFTIENPDVKMIEQLNIAKASAEKANRAKTDFLSSMSHEIRTPLNAIVGFSEMIDNEVTIEGCKENAKDIVLASQTLLEIVNGILDISKIEANKMEIVNKEYELLPELENLSKLMVPRIGERPIELKTQFAADIPAIMYGDIGKIKQVITNILTNAVKYTEQGEINFNVNCVNENDTCSLVISVEDTGRGIKPDKIDSLFTKFNRLDEDKNTTIEGTGLGLAITKSLTEMMGGKIIVQSVYGKGSKFTIYLRQKIVKQEGSIASVEKQEESFNFAGFNVLVVDDNKLNLKVADKILKTYSLSTTLIDSGLECIDLIKNGKKYDLILMDDMMPQLKGPEVLEKLKEIEGFNIPVIALTANATTGIKEQYINMGFNDYLAKPINKVELTEVLNKFLSNDKEVVEKNESPKSSNKKQVLIVDDNKLNIKIAANLMKDYNFEIEEAMSGQECIDKVKNKKYDLIFLDYMMPEMDGIETLKHLKELPNFDATAIALTADAVEGSREKFLNAGFDEYVSKPIVKNMLDKVIEKMLNKNNNKKEIQEVIENKSVNSVDYLKENGIDVDRGLELLGDMEMYNDTLKEFMSGMNDKFNKIKTYKENNDMENYAIEVHSLKSDSKYLGFTKLAEISYDHEMKSKANDIEYVNNNFNELFNEIKRVFDVVKKYLS